MRCVDFSLSRSHNPHTKITIHPPWDTDDTAGESPPLGNFSCACLLDFPVPLGKQFTAPPIRSTASTLATGLLAILINCFNLCRYISSTNLIFLRFTNFSKLRSALNWGGTKLGDGRGAFVSLLLVSHQTVPLCALCLSHFALCPRPWCAPTRSGVGSVFIWVRHSVGGGTNHTHSVDVKRACCFFLAGVCVIAYF